MNATDEILIDVQENIGTVTFNRTQARNALTFTMYERLAEICADPPPDAKVLVINGAGDKAFAAGTDIAQFRDFTTPQHAIEYEATMDRVVGQIEQCALPTIAAINGACTGGGAVIASACDIRIATQQLRFGFPIARTLGNCLSAANISRLTALLGAGRVREIIYTSRLIEATEAERIGLVTELLDNNTRLMQRAYELAMIIMQHAPLTLQATKQIQLRLAEHQVEDRDWIVKCYTSEDFRQGLDAFLAKRKPHWMGR